jgi:2-polyprenyl-3-methyl-5-hydroxy-6-metoxy-1,4-benzoquinol methylase
MIETATPTDYFSHLRHDVLAMVPEDARTILSVGCGSGRTEAELVKRGCEVHGIEQNADAAEAARARGIRVIEGDATDPGTLPEGVVFDALIYADVLEHIADPVAVMKVHVARLREGGAVVISVPNFRHVSVFRELFVGGMIRYKDAGIMDRTHVRITTRKMIEGWFGEVGVGPVRCEYVLPRRRDRLLSRLTLGLFNEFQATQVLLLGRKGGGRG